MTTEERQRRLDRTRQEVHARCVACGSTNDHAPRLCFVSTAPGRVEATFQPDGACEGYAGMLHGGVIATLLDAAMTNCLFAQGCRGVTADLHVRYRHPVSSGEACSLRAWIERSSPPLFVVRGELTQGDRRKVTASGKFMTPSVLPGDRAPRDCELTRESTSGTPVMTNADARPTARTDMVQSRSQR